MSDYQKRLLLGFDRVLHAYSRGWEGGRIYDGPIPGAQEACRRLMAQFDVVVFTARADSGARAHEVREWMRDKGFPELEVTNVKHPAELLVDQRAYRFQVMERDPYATWPVALTHIEQLTGTTL